MSVNNEQQELNDINDAGQASVSSGDDLAVLDDLSLTAATKADIKAGRHCLGCNWGPPMTNHNETIAADDGPELADLGLTDAESDGIKGGQSDPLPPTRSGGGGYIGNHNETIDADDADDLELDDLITVADDAQVKGGRGGWGSSMYQYALPGTSAGQSAPPPERPTGGGGFINNHNETTVSDEGEEAEAATLDDLPVAEEQADLTKGGMLSSGRVRVSTSSGY